MGEGGEIERVEGGEGRGREGMKGGQWAELVTVWAWREQRTRNEYRVCLGSCYLWV